MIYGSNGSQLNNPLLYRVKQRMPSPIPHTPDFTSSNENWAKTAPNRAGSKNEKESVTFLGSIAISLVPTITPTTSKIILTKTEAPTPIVDITEPSSDPTSVFVALRAAAAQGILRLLIFPDKKEKYVPGIPSIGKKEIGSMNHHTAFTDNWATNATIRGPFSGTILKRYVTAKAGKKTRKAPIQHVHFPAFVICGIYVSL